MRRNSTLAVLPPVATMTPFRARILSFLPLASTVIPVTRPVLLFSRIMLVILCSRRICTPAFRAAASSGRTMPMPPEMVFPVSMGTATPV